MSDTKAAPPKTADAYRSIGEAASELGLQTHVLRYWEGKFPALIKPVKRPDGRRLFRAKDLEALRAIQILVHERGLTLKGAKQLLEEQGVDAVLSGDVRLTAKPAASVDPVAPARKLEAEPAASPVHRLQDTVASAFDASPERPALTSDSVARLKTVLADITDLKARLDAARARKAA